MAARRLLIFAHALRIGRVASTARETFPTKVGTIYTLVATRHLQSLATALGTPNREMSIASVSTYSAAMFSTSRRTRFKPLESVVRRQVVWLTAHHLPGVSDTFSSFCVQCAEGKNRVSYVCDYVVRSACSPSFRRPLHLQIATYVYSVTRTPRSHHSVSSQSRVARLLSLGW